MINKYFNGEIKYSAELTELEKKDLEIAKLKLELEKHKRAEEILKKKLGNKETVVQRFSQVRNISDYLTIDYFYNEKKYDLSLSEFKKIELYLKDNSYFNFKIGMCYFKKGNWANAVHYFEKSKNLKGFKESWNIQYHAAKKHFKTNR